MYNIPMLLSLGTNFVFGTFQLGFNNYFHPSENRHSIIAIPSIAAFVLLISFAQISRIKTPPL